MNRYRARWDLQLAEMASNKEIHSVEFDMQDKTVELPAYKSAVETTDKLLRRIKRKAQDIPVLLVLIDDFEPYKSDWKKLADKHAFPLFVPMRHVVIPSEAYLKDRAHYNQLGNQIVGEAFIKSAVHRGLLLPDPSSAKPG